MYYPDLERGMKMAGYVFDEIDSHDDWIVFDSVDSRVAFNSWDEVYDWLDGVVFDDPEISDAVEKILHPERF